MSGLVSHMGMVEWAIWWTGSQTKLITSHQCSPVCILHMLLQRAKKQNWWLLHNWLLYYSGILTVLFCYDAACVSPRKTLILLFSLTQYYRKKNILWLLNQHNMRYLKAYYIYMSYIAPLVWWKNTNPPLHKTGAILVRAHHGDGICLAPGQIFIIFLGNGRKLQGNLQNIRASPSVGWLVTLWDTVCSALYSGL